MSSLIGKRLQGGKYKLETVLGRGGFGLTFRAHQMYLDSVVVIKTLNESLWSAPNLNDLQRQFQDEARRLAMCSHPNVVRVSDFFVEDGLPYMVMDYIPGRSLADIVLPGNPLPETTAISYIQQIGKALQAVHGKGLLHRDVKPQNIMIHELTGDAILIDFGIARELTQSPTQTHTSIVSEGYAPIEQYLPKAQRSAATDIYGLAATLYTLLTAEVPVAATLRDRSPMAPVQQLRPQVSSAVADAIAQGMQIELKDRPQSVGRWVASLTDRQSRRSTQRPTQKPPNVDPSWSQAPTQVVAPGYRSAPAATQGKTVAARIPTGYDASTIASDTAAQVPLARAKGKGCGCASTLGIVTLAIAGVAAGAGFWLYQQVSDGLANRPKLELPSVELPVPEDSQTTTEPDENQTAEKPKKDKPKKIAEQNTEDAEQPEILEGGSADQSFTSDALPVLLGDRGNPDSVQAGGNGSMVPIPGLAPGTPVSSVEARLGTPSQTLSANGYSTSVYDMVPNRVALAYTYDPSSSRVRQSEATFSPATDRLVMRTALLGMLDGRSTEEIENGLEAVRTGDRDRFEFSRKGFDGTIERNAYGHVHIYVRN